MSLVVIRCLQKIYKTIPTSTQLIICKTLMYWRVGASTFGACGTFRAPTMPIHARNLNKLTGYIGNSNQNSCFGSFIS